jgi:GNAT superfamily N-acetyltransferase
VALEGPAICGFATIGAANDQGDGSLGELLARYVDPDRWGQGIGRLLSAG